MLRASLSFLFIIILSLYIICQESERDSIVISLHSKVDSVLFGGTYINLSKLKESDTELSKFKIPNNITDFATYYVELNGYQSAYSRMVNNELNYKDSINCDFRELQKFANSHNKPLKTGTYFISASQGKSILVITDSNNNLDFTDEVIDVFRYDALPQMLGNTHISKMPQKKLEYEYYLKDGNEIIRKEVNIRLFLAADRYKDSLYRSKPRLKLVLKSDEGRIGDFSLGQDDYRVLVQPSNASFDRYNNVSLKVFSTQDSMPRMSNLNRKILREEDFIPLGDKLYQIISPSIFGSELILKEVLSHDTIYGDRPKQHIKDFQVKTINDEIYKLSDKQGKYVLLYFWGMWNYPCLKVLPDLKRIRETYSDLEMTSIAILRGEETIEELRSFVKDENLNWTQISDNPKSVESSVIKLRIRAYPTYILIDPYGKILYRSLEMSRSTSKLDEILLGIYKEKE